MSSTPKSVESQLRESCARLCPMLSGGQLVPLDLEDIMDMPVSKLWHRLTGDLVQDNVKQCLPQQLRNEMQLA